MRLFRSSYVIAFLLPGLFISLAHGRSSSTYERSLKLVSFESVDLAPLTSELRRRQDALSDRELDQVVQRNLRYIFYNRINRSHFLVAPAPNKVITQIDMILQLNQKLKGVLQRGRLLMSQDYSRSELFALLDEVNLLAKDLKSEFFEFFVEGHASKYSLLFSDSRDCAVQFAHFLVQSSKISVELNRGFETYFFGASPGAISLNEYGENSIGTLIESLETLSVKSALKIAGTDLAR
ncbi:MAG TPA: hypothetical protein VMY18_05560 [Acidobacteriota bacterium]|nr:hypothetical protein [Acidobacteriota bacterium]